MHPSNLINQYAVHGCPIRIRNYADNNPGLMSFYPLRFIHSLDVNGVNTRDIDYPNDLDELKTSCEQQQPDIVFINETCLAPQSQNCNKIRNLISEHPQCLFVIFMSSTRNHFEEYVFVRKNVIITSKSIKLPSLNQADKSSYLPT